MKKRNTVYAVSLFVTSAIVIWSIIACDNFIAVSSRLYELLSVNLGWLYLLLIAGFVVFCVGIACSRFGRIRLGGDDEQPEYSTVSWFAMLFCAGMGVGLVFWGVSEPITHFLSPDAMEGGTPEAAEFAMQATFMHWGVHPWAIYAVIGLSIAYFSFRKGEKNLLSRVFVPILGQRAIDGGIGKAIDVITVVITVMGISTSLGLGALQINGGVSYLTGLPFGLKTQIIIIALVTVAFTISSVSGVDKGIKLLSNINLVMAIALAAAAFLVGPKLEIVNSFINGLGDYLSGIVKESLKLHTYGDNTWIIGWRVFYWAWWISWGPFVGSFIARISRGRTIRQFMIGVLLVPTAVSCIWFAIFGNLGIHLAMENIFTQGELGEIISTPETALFIVLGEYPLGVVLSVIAIVLLFTFFITSADSGTFVLGIFTSDGEQNPANTRKIIWCFIISLLAIGLLVTGGLESVQTVSLVVAFPFLFIMVGCCVSLVKSLRGEADGDQR